MKRASVAPCCRAALIAVCALLGACSSSAPSRFYTLSGVTTHSGVVQGASPDSGSVAVSAVTIPGTLDRPQMVRFANGGRVEVFEEARWSEPLAHGIARILAEDMSARLGNTAVAAYPQDASARARYRISVDFSHFDVDTSGAVTLDAIWSIRDTYVAPLQPGGSAPQPLRTTDRLVGGHARITESANGSASAEASLRAEDNALGELADQLSSAYRQFQTAP